MLARLLSLVKQYPARTASITAAVVVFVAAKAGIVLDQESVGHALAIIVPILVAGEATHHAVTPVAE